MNTGKQGGKRPGAGRPKAIKPAKKVMISIDSNFVDFWERLPKMKRSFFVNQAMTYYKQKRPDLFRALIEKSNEPD